MGGRAAEHPVAESYAGVRCYDNGGRTWDRYTVVYTGRDAIDRPRGKH